MAHISTRVWQSKWTVLPPMLYPSLIQRVLVQIRCLSELDVEIKSLRGLPWIQLSRKTHKTLVIWRPRPSIFTGKHRGDAAQSRVISNSTSFTLKKQLDCPGRPAYLRRWAVAQKSHLHLFVSLSIVVHFPAESKTNTQPWFDFCPHGYYCFTYRQPRGMCLMYIRATAYMLWKPGLLLLFPAHSCIKSGNLKICIKVVFFNLPCSSQDKRRVFFVIFVMPPWPPLSSPRFSITEEHTAQRGAAIFLKSALCNESLLPSVVPLGDRVRLLYCSAVNPERWGWDHK